MWTSLSPSFTRLSLWLKWPLLPTCPFLPHLSNTLRLSITFPRKFPSNTPSFLTEPDAPADSSSVLCFNPVTVVVTEQHSRQYISLVGKNCIFTHSSLHPCHLAKYLAHGRNSKLVDQRIRLTNKEWEMRHSGRMSQARFPALASYSAQVCHRRHVKQTLWSFLLFFCSCNIL